MNRRIWCIKEK